ncbi:1,3-beta-glucanase [Rhizobium sp. R72]|uniref:glycoside hydrolase family 16 protein n=1 Tax=unclassified Rhizobium TaxID=2613769 RepID=UPI000B713DD1|nr:MULTISPECIES: family 16 glycosylhydrolase [unclassified Rhizobium]OWV96115.1 1,3-beta-glucanase [Rhizobium sp. R72]OWV96599.1 1,3-beta-glucanase [Rhizobium sp. R711]
MAGRSMSRRGFISTTIALACAGLGRVGPANADADDPTAARHLVFEDNFSQLDWSVWNAGPKAGKSDPGFYGRSAFARRTGEEGFNPYAIVDDPRAADGKALQISAKYIGAPMSVPSYYGNNHSEYQWISGNIQTASKDGTVTQGWRRGYFEARMLFPSHPLTWPAFWLMNARSILGTPTSIELDVVEHKGFELSQYGTYLHEWGQPGEHHEGTGVAAGLDLTQDYRRYGILVDDTKCVPYFERKPVIDTRTGQPANWQIHRSLDLDVDGDVFWPLLTLALRADVPYPKELTPDQLQPHMRVDYLRVFV